MTPKPLVCNNWAMAVDDEVGVIVLGIETIDFDAPLAYCVLSLDSLKKLHKKAGELITKLERKQ
jgi:hypothetical protein